MGADRGRPGRGLLLIAAAALAPFGLRAIQLVQKRGGFGLDDVGGVLSDTAVVALFVAGLIGLGAISRIGAALAAAAWAIAHYANYENVRALDALASFADVRFLGDMTFVRGSALWISEPLLLAAAVVGSLGLGFAGARGLRARHALVALVVGFLLLGAHTAWMQARPAVGWRHANFVHANATRALRAASPGGGSSDRLFRIHPGLRADLTGEPRFPTREDGPRNVLIVFLEGASGAFLPSFATAHGTFPGPVLERLDRRSQNALRFTSFVSHQRRTNRGLYTSLCGELPNLNRTTPKMSAYAGGGGPRCLPQVLADAGYQTVYLQAAPLAFMLKDQFMPRAGFAHVHGREWFGTGHAESVWGVDDLAFFEQALVRVDELRASDEPWLLTLLTVGTHHPTLVPDDFDPGAHRFARALAYADLALDGFLDALEQRRVFDDTLVFITSDESRGAPGRRSEMAAALTQSWGLGVAFTPEGWTGEVSEPYGQFDLALSVLDYLALGEQGAHFQGRSLFRRYDRGRYVFFANLNLDLAGAIAPDRTVVFCPGSSRHCQRLGAPDGRVFSHEIRALDARASVAPLVRDVVRHSGPAVGGGVRDRTYALGTEVRVVVQNGGPQLVHGGQDVNLGAGQWLDVEIAARVVGSGTGTVVFEHYLEADGWSGSKRFEQRVRAGEPLRLEYSLHTEEALSNVRSRSFVRLDGAAPLALHFDRARMVVHTVGEPPPPGLHVRAGQP